MWRLVCRNVGKIEIDFNKKNMKTKICSVYLVENDINELIDIINKIKNTFNNVSYKKIKEVDWSGNEKLDIDFRTTVYFYSTKSKNNIYNKMNDIKSNHIKFY